MWSVQQQSRYILPLENAINQYTGYRFHWETCKENSRSLVLGSRKEGGGKPTTLKCASCSSELYQIVSMLLVRTFQLSTTCVISSHLKET